MFELSVRSIWYPCDALVTSVIRDGAGIHACCPVLGDRTDLEPEEIMYAKHLEALDGGQRYWTVQDDDRQLSDAEIMEKLHRI